MRKILALFGGLLFVGPASQASDMSTWQSIFNGKDLTGWTVKFTGSEIGQDTDKVFRVEDGMLRVSYDPTGSFSGQFGHLFYHQKLSHYRLRFQYRFTGEQLTGGPAWAWRNSGVMVHSQAVDTMTIDQDFPVSIESQLLGGPDEGDRPTGNVCSPGTHITVDGEFITQHCVNSSSETFRGDQWVNFEVEVRGGDVIRHYVNGKQVLELRDPVYDSLGAGQGYRSVMDGHIALQAESHNVDFRNIQLMILPVK